MSLTEQLLVDLHREYENYFELKGRVLTTEWVKEWQAPCYLPSESSGLICWQAVEQAEEAKVDFTGLESAVQLKLNQDFKTFFSSHWAGDLHLYFNDEPITLLQVQSPEDAERLQANLIGHLLMKEKLGQAPTLFIGLSSEEDKIISVDNSSGAVCYEYVGKPAHEEIAPSIASFLAKVVPDPKGYPEQITKNRL